MNTLEILSSVEEFQPLDNLDFDKGTNQDQSLYKPVTPVHYEKEVIKARKNLGGNKAYTQLTFNVEGKEPSSLKRKKENTGKSKTDDFMTGQTGIGLNVKQAEAFQLGMQGKNVFITGPGGTGKTYLCNKLLAELKKKYSVEREKMLMKKRDKNKKPKLENEKEEEEDESFDVVHSTAPTACAALLINGRTIHKWSGLNENKHGENPEKLRRNLQKYKPGTVERWRDTKVLFIDECSMLSDKFLDLIDKFAKHVRKEKDKTVPFGGMQVILCGDLFQLPPVKGDPINFSRVFDNFIMVELKEPFRQKNPEFFKVLSNVRACTYSEDDWNFLKGLEREVEFGSHEPPILCSTRKEAEVYNNERLKKLDASTEHSFEAKDIIQPKTVQKNPYYSVDANSLVPQTLTLRLGARVMLVINIDDEFYNGMTGNVVTINRCIVTVKFDCGKVKDFVWGENKQVIRDERDFEEASRTQIPLILAFALTIHKVQGATLDSAIIDCGKLMNNSMFYVALSRVRDAENLRLINTKSLKSLVPREMMSRRKMESRLAEMKSVRKEINKAKTVYY